MALGHESKVAPVTSWGCVIFVVIIMVIISSWSGDLMDEMQRRQQMTLQRVNYQTVLNAVINFST